MPCYQLEPRSTYKTAGAMVSLLTKDGVSPLHRACQGGHVDVVHTLLSRGAKVELLTKDGLSPLHVAIQAGHMPMSTCRTRMVCHPCMW